MAPERTSRPGGSGLPGMRNSALATAALTSVALLSQTAGAAPAAGDDGPSRDEVRQRVDNLYNRAETDTGTYNATRAAAIPRQRSAASADAERRGAGSVSGDTREAAAPALTDVARQWFDVARAKLGPTVPAARMPVRPTRPPRPAERPTNALALEGPKAAVRAAPEPTVRSALNSTARSAPALPGAPEPSRDTSTSLPAASTASAAGSGPSSLRATKLRNQRKLAQAREMLAAPTAPLSTPPAAIEPRPAEDVWRTPAEPAHTATGAWDTAAWDTATWDTGAWEPLPQTGLAPDLPVTPSPLPSPAPPADPAPAFASGLPVDPALAPVPGPPVEPAPAFTPGPPVAPASAAPATHLPAAPVTAPVVAGHAVDAGYDLKAAKVLAFARAQIGRPCVWGAAGPGSYDPSGLTQAAWKTAGVELPRSAQAQAGAGTAVSLAEVRVGDLVLFYDDLSHVGLYIGNGMMIHAPGPGTYIREESVYYAGESTIRGAVRPA
ncbi:C40 family peptidase [Streptomyces sp. NPDC003011]